jgi:hypothetical protein
MPTTSLSILIPFYNEEEYIGLVIERVLKAPLPEGMDREIIVVDDGSTDGSAEVAASFAARYPDVVRLFRHARNQGKGAAIRTALEKASGEFTLIQDADLEYDPNEYSRLLTPLLEGKADVVYGSRFLVAGERRVLYFWHAVANWALTLLCNMVADLNLTDVETCYKASRTSLLQSIPIRSNRFGIEPELTVKLAQRRVRIYETPIGYDGRTYEEGKKIGLRDAFAAFAVILRYGLTSDIYKEHGSAILEALSGAGRPRHHPGSVWTGAVWQLGRGPRSLPALFTRGTARQAGSGRLPNRADAGLQPGLPARLVHAGKSVPAVFGRPLAVARLRRVGMAVAPHRFPFAVGAGLDHRYLHEGRVRRGVEPFLTARIPAMMDTYGGDR